MKIKVPQSLKDCTPDQLVKWVFLSTGEIKLETLSDSLDFRVQVVSIFSGISKPKLYNMDAKTITKVFNHIMNILNTESDLVGHVSINGKKYVFNQDFDSWKTGAIIDIKLIESVYESPYEVLAILYIEDGLIYNQVDDRDRIMNPTKERIELFKEHFPGDEFLNVFGFFLDRWQLLKDAIYIMNMKKTTKTMKKMKNEIKKDLTILNGSIGQRT